MTPRWSRRYALKTACLLPAGALSAHWLIGCGDDPASPGAQAGSPGTTAGTQAGSQAGSTAQSSAGVGAGTGAAAGAGSGAGSGAVAQAGSTAQAGASGSSSGAGGASGASGMNAGASGMAQAGGGAGGASGIGAGGAAGVAAPGVPWATGGTKSMTGSYPDPFAGGPSGTPCVVYPSQTLGPCYADMPGTRQDISDGLTGLPVRLSFLVTRVDGCTPVPNAGVDIWHSGSDGIYSAFATGTVCNPSTMNVMDEMFCRGVQITNDQGRVDFSTVFPGWYTGRTIHIHFTVLINGRASITSQLYFEDALSDEILAQGSYAARGKRDTNNARDSTFRSGGAMPAQILMSTAKRPDGVLHAWKVLSIA